MKSSLILCSTSRLARSLRVSEARRRRDEGLLRWTPLPAMELSLWLDTVIGDALLCGDISSATAPLLVPDAFQERILWERAIEDSLSHEVAAALFDLGGMAAAAMEANRLQIAWRIRLADEELSEESRQFLRWRAAFRKQCAESGWMEPARYLEWQIDQLEAGAGVLPQQLYLAGFDRLSPQEERLFHVLAGRTVEIVSWGTGGAQPGPGSRVELPDREAECRAAVAWAQQQLQSNPRARIAIVAPELGAIRSRLAALLDDGFHPVAITAKAAEATRCYDFSLGVPLSTQPLIACALTLLRAFRARRRLEQGTLSSLLSQPYWSAGLQEADGKAILDAAMRRDLPSVLSLDRWARYVRKMADRGVAVPLLADHLEAALQLAPRSNARQLPSAWAASFRMLLGALGWPGARGVSSHEYQARQAFYELLDGLSRMDKVLGEIDIGAAMLRLQQACAEQIFQPRSEGDPNIVVMGMLEATGEPLDAIWVMGMNDHLWPPPARPNPLLPASAQRAARAPNADASVQAEFARAIHSRLLRSASNLVFSHAHAEGDRELRLSPLIASLPLLGEVPLQQTLAETLAASHDQTLEFIDDHRAPAVSEGERVAGGASLLRAQAVCPAWAYFQYRLGGRKLETPIDGLDAAGRGSLLHMALELFWRGRSLPWLQSLSETEQAEAVRGAIARAMARFDADREEPLPAGFSALEAARLQRVLTAWLEYEKSRTESFEVQDCEREVKLEIEGISVRLVIDRVDVLADGGVILLDYKTGSNLDHKNWAQERMTEPQLPIYASLALAGEQVVGVAFARVRRDEGRFIGISRDAALLPDVSGLQEDKARKDFPEQRFPTWDALVAHWKSSVEAIAREVRQGEAAVRFSEEKDLEYCDVKPLLRLPERKLLFERNGD